MATSEGLLQVLTDEGPEDAPESMPGVYLARATKVQGSQLHFVIDDFARELEFGPVEYPRPAAETTAVGGGDFAVHSHGLRTPATPPVGTKLVVAFLGGDPDRPEILKVKGWPS